MSFLWRDIAPFVSDAGTNAGSGRLGRRHLLLGIALGGAMGMSMAMSGRAAMAADSGAEGARKFVDDTAGKAIALMANKSLDDKARAQQFRDLFVASFDLPAIGRAVLGRYWKTATPDQQTQFLKLFEEQQVLSWSARFKTYNGEKLTVDAPTAADGGWQIMSHIDRPGGGPIPLEWSVSGNNGGWHVTDLAVDGASMALTLRQDFASVIQANGGKIDALLAALQKKVDQLGGGVG